MTTWDEQVQDWEHAVDGVGRGLLGYIAKALGIYLPYPTQRRYGRWQAVSTANRTVTVSLEPAATSGSGPPTESSTIQADFGRPTWTAAAIVGKRVAVWETRQWIAEGLRLRQVALSYVVDDVVGT